jgi:hypothetical protein
MRPAHFLIGSLGVVVFLGTGLYMRASFPELYAGDEALRHMYRANHVYLLLASLVNMVLGIYLVAPGGGWRAVLSRIGSGLAILSPMVLCYAFFAEVPKASPERIFTTIGIVLVALGVLAQLPGYPMSRRS